MKYLKIFLLFFVSTLTMSTIQAGPDNSPESALRQIVLDKLSVSNWDILESGSIAEAAIYFTVDREGFIHVRSVKSHHSEMAELVQEILDNKTISVEGLDCDKSYVVRAKIRKE